MKTKLDSVEGILKAFDHSSMKPNCNSSAADGMGCPHYDHGCLTCRENTETAAYLARAVRIAEAWDKQARPPVMGNLCNECTADERYEAIRRAAKGEDK